MTQTADPVAAQQTLGHRSVETTLKHYVAPNPQRDAALLSLWR